MIAPPSLKPVFWIGRTKDDLSAFAEETHRPLPAVQVQVDIIQVEADDLTDSCAGSIQNLQHGPIAQRRRGIPQARSRQQPLDLGDRDGLRQSFGHPGWRHPLRRVRVGYPLQGQEPVKPTDRDEGSGCRGCRQRCSSGRPLTQRGQELRDIGLAHRGGTADASPDEELLVSGKVPPVGGQRVVGRPAFDPEMVEPSSGRTRQGFGLGQRRTSSRGRESNPCASATGP